ncbi:MAG: hypothetical protein NT062_11395 [Proteobacteria bacterium]|nr:hypothetical protein [Pseudomonadota bacterium]
MPTPIELMASFAERTGVRSARSHRRYLWTDAFAACNFVGLGQPELAVQLIDRVHHELGRHRPDDADARHSWISGLPEAEGEDHPTRGGLRIGKPRAEREGSPTWCGGPASSPTSPTGASCTTRAAAGGCTGR